MPIDIILFLSRLFGGGLNFLTTDPPGEGGAGSGAGSGGQGGGSGSGMWQPVSVIIRVLPPAIVYCS